VAWLVALALLIYLTRRITNPIQQLTSALRRLGQGEHNVRVPERRRDEIGEAIDGFNDMAAQLEQNRERLLFVARLESWQMLARKMAHEVKNSLTPIRLTVEEMVARHGSSDPAFLKQAAQIVTDEVTGLEKRVRAFSDLASEPPVHPAPLDVNALLAERMAFLRPGHPAVQYESRLDSAVPQAWADEDLVRGILTNLIENASHAAPAVLGLSQRLPDGRVAIEVHDSGPGLSASARKSLFEPTISFKKSGMGLGLSIARKSALLNRGDIELIDSELGGAAFRVTLPGAES
jgi:nitrogen fixation/metabolism regulation signal transduction histidine kinase